MVISVYLLKETREKSVIFDEDAVLTAAEKVQAAGRLGVGWAVGAAAVAASGPRPETTLRE